MHSDSEGGSGGCEKTSFSGGGERKHLSEVGVRQNDRWSYPGVGTIVAPSMLFESSTVRRTLSSMLIWRGRGLLNDLLMRENRTLT